ncbi:hypothetical protein LTR85_001963 [Meristemomyces frigidus]|nr:hypothetical protein LTR85_001963 [Meristemomyces frigidus]
MSAVQDDHSPLLALPPELRNHIYEDTIADGENVIIAEDGTMQSQPSLLLTCRQIRAESLPLYYDNTFRLTISDDDKATAIAWLHSLAPNEHGSRIRALIIEISFDASKRVPIKPKTTPDRWGLLGKETVKCGLPTARVRVQASHKLHQRSHLGDEQARDRFLWVISAACNGRRRELNRGARLQSLMLSAA